MENTTMATATLATDVKDAGTNLAKETVCVTVSFGVLGNSRKLNVSALNVRNGNGTIHAAKKLLESPELETINSRDSEVRRNVYDLCVPFDTGIHLLARPAVPEMRKTLRDYEEIERPELVEAFLSAYPRRRDEGIARITRLCAENGWQLSDVLKPKDYPSVAEVRRRFYFEYAFVSLGTPDNLPADIQAEEREKAAKRWLDASEEITAVMRLTLSELVTHLRERLEPSPDGKQKVLRETAVTNLTEFLKTFDLRNVTNDSELSDLATKCRSLLSGRSADMFRESENLRRSVASDLAGIKSELDKLVADKPSRKFRFEED